MHFCKQCHSADRRNEISRHLPHHGSGQRGSQMRCHQGSMRRPSEQWGHIHRGKEAHTPHALVSVVRSASKASDRKVDDRGSHWWANTEKPCLVNRRFEIIYSYRDTSVVPAPVQRDSPETGQCLDSCRQRQGRSAHVAPGPQGHFHYRLRWKRVCCVEHAAK